jgi:hypothetical protein
MTAGPHRNLFDLKNRCYIMAGAEDQAITRNSNEAALQDFGAGIRRSIKQADTGLLKTFETKEEFLNHLKNLE